MPPRIRTQSVGRPTAESLGGGIGKRVGRGGWGRRPREGNDERVDDLNGQGNDQGMGAKGGVSNLGNVGNQNGNVVNENVQENVRNVIVNGNRVESKLWNHAMVGAGHAAYTDRFHELARLVPHLVTPKSRMIERYMYGLALQIRGMVTATEPKTIQKVVQIFGVLTDEAVRNRSIKKARGRAFMLGAEEALQDPNIMTGLEPNELGFKYEIKIASGQLVKINKVIRDCKLEIEGHVFDIELIPFGHRSFDIIIGLDWLSNYMAEIICHKKVVRVPLSDGKVVRVVGERPDEKERLLMCDKASDKKQKDI
ncbi:putative reverse transcriptase domain-containing protein, partial [Tanacetum coccineum]